MANIWTFDFNMHNDNNDNNNKCNVAVHDSVISQKYRNRDRSIGINAFKTIETYGFMLLCVVCISDEIFIES